jgi:hypothetical protein
VLYYLLNFLSAVAVVVVAAAKFLVADSTAATAPGMFRLLFDFAQPTAAAADSEPNLRSAQSCYWPIASKRSATVDQRNKRQNPHPKNMKR